MSEERNKSYRIKTEVNKDKYVSVQLNQDYDTFNILSLSIGQADTYKLHNSNYGVIVGRVLANNGFGVPNAKVSIFIEADSENVSDEVLREYPYSSPTSKGYDDIRYNLLPDNKVDDCYQIVGTFPNKSYMLANDVLMEVYDKYYLLSTRTNEAGDYMIAGVPTGSTKIHMDLDLSDCGILSQRPRDFVYKGYNINEFESPTVFKTSKTLDSLKQIISQNVPVYIYPFWGNDSLGETIGITRCDINVNFKFEPTAVFIGSVVSDPASNGISKNCIPTNEMGAMDELTTGKGKIEMIRKTIGGDVESFAIKGNELINGDGVWCYQIPMNLDYIVTDEYGNMVPTDDIDKGIPTRARVRFRMSMDDFDENSDNYFRAKILVPHNPQESGSGYTGGLSNKNVSGAYDYVFGTNTKDESYRDLLWNNVYTVKQFIPRFQKSQSYKSERFTGIKHTNHFGSNNPMPYNNIRIRLPFMFRIMCALIKAYIRIVKVLNNVIYHLAKFLARLNDMLDTLLYTGTANRVGGAALSMKYVTVADGLCPDLENWYFAPNKYGNLIMPLALNNDDGPSVSETKTFTTYIRPYFSKTGGEVEATITLTGDYAKYFICFVEYDDKPKRLWTSYPKEDLINNKKIDSDQTADGKKGSTKLYDINGQFLGLPHKEGEASYYLCIPWHGESIGTDTSNSLTKPYIQDNDGISVGTTKLTIEVVANGVTYKYDESFPAYYDIDSAKYDDGGWESFAISTLKQGENVNLYNQTIYYLQQGDEEASDTKSIDYQNSYSSTTEYSTEETAEGMCITKNTDYLISCIEMNLAQEYRVINFDFYNDWINGVLYFPRWMMQYREKKKYLNGAVVIKAKTKGCMADSKIFGRNRRITQQCAVVYRNSPDASGLFSKVYSNPGGKNGKQDYHKKYGKQASKIFKKNGGVIKQQQTIAGENVYYYKPCEWNVNSGRKVNLFATDLVLLGSLNECSRYGIPMAFKYLTGSSYKMPTNLALTNMDDDSYVYGMQDGSYCTKTPKVGDASDYSEIGTDASSVKQISTSFKSTATYYSGVSQSEEYIGYGTSDQNAYESGQTTTEDLIAITEAAGIAWNYTGPGQGVKNDDKFYQPGGHFLGLSCTNSQTNIKSCLNLQRICEAGVSMSQRQEKITKVNSITGDEASFAHRYFVPTGLIGHDEITGPGFRAMFATMNMRPLICDELDTTTGYYKYKFIYDNPNGFDGSLSNLINKANNYYNTKSGNITEEDVLNAVDDALEKHITVNGDDVIIANGSPIIGASLDNNVNSSSLIDYSKFKRFSGMVITEKFNNNNSYDRIVSNTSTFKLYDNSSLSSGNVSEGENEISLEDLKFLIEEMGVSLGDDFDMSEFYNTYRKTVDNPNVYYHKFRLGLSAITPSTTAETASKYLLQNGDSVAMPQYENSFYFYFGLHDGSTAFDEFLSQFFSECPGEDSGDSGYIVVTKTSDERSTKGSFTITMFDMTPSYKIIIADSNGNSVKTESVSESKYSCSDLALGTYIISVYDSDEYASTPLTATIIFSEPTLFASYSKKDIDYLIKGQDVDKKNVHDNIVEKNESEECGYIEFNRTVEINGEQYDLIDDKTKVCCVVYNPNALVYSNGSTKSYSEYMYSTNGTGFTNNLSDNITNVPTYNKDNVKVVGDNVRIYVGTQDISYQIYIQYKINDEVNCLKYDELTINGIDNMNMYLGSSYLKYNSTDSEWTLSTISNVDYLTSMKTKDDDDSKPYLWWALRHYLTNQNPDQTATFDANLYCIGKDGNISNNYYLFGQPENVNKVLTSGGLYDNGVYSNSDKRYYYGYALNDSLIRHECYSNTGTNDREWFGKMAVDDGAILEDGAGGILSSCNRNDGVTTFTIALNGQDGQYVKYLRAGRGVIISIDETLIPCIITNVNNSGSLTGKSYGEYLYNSGKECEVHKLFYYPVVNAPMSACVYYFTSNLVEDVAYPRICERVYCEFSNGITYGKKFGYARFFNTSDYSIDIEETESDYVFLDTNKPRTTRVGYNASETIDDGCQVFMRTTTANKIHYGFSIQEGHPSTIPAEMNIPYKYTPYICSGSSDVMFEDVISWNIYGGTVSFKTSQRKRTRYTVNDETAKYYAVIDSTVCNPVVNSEGIKTIDTSTGQILNPSYYEEVVANAGENGPCFELEFKKVYNIDNAANVKFVIARAECVSNGNRIVMFKFYNNGK